MNVTPISKILNNESNAVTLKPAEAMLGNVCADRIALSVEGGSIAITAKLSADTTAAPLAAIKDADMTIVSGTISAAGNYTICCDAYDEIIITGTAATVWAKYLY